MTDTHPDGVIACRLTSEELAGLEARMDEYRSLGREGLLAVDGGDRRAVLRFRPGAEIRRRVDALVAAESRCCAFLGYAVEERPDAIVLSLTAHAGGEAPLHDLVGAVAGAD